MKKLFVTMLLALTAIALVLPVWADEQAATTAPPSAAPKKEIKDPAEYNSYVGAIQQQDPQAKISGLLDFAQRYPNSAYKEDALEQLMALYQGLNDGPKTMAMANQILQSFPNNIRALALMVYSKRIAAQSGQNPQQNQQDLADARKMSERGLAALKTAVKPEGMSDADFEKFKSQVAVVFNGAMGLWSLQNKDYRDAQEHLRAAVNTNPNDFKDVYPLALAYLSPKPADDVNGLWFAARSVHLATAAGFPEQNVNAISEFGRKRFIKYHGGEDGWTVLLEQSKNTPLPPPGFTIPPAPTPADQARMLVESKDPKQMNFAEWELVLSAGEPPVADKVWSVIKGQTVQFAGKVISATRTTLLIAATVDAIEQKQPDVEVTMATPLLQRLVPRPGADIEILAVPASYEPQPFVMKMSKGSLRPQAPPRRTGRRG
ncbi:MAG: tetratricopeptide repeat protein [Terriglobales bacterium]